jgi:hypothetical protein
VTAFVAAVFVYQDACSASELLGLQIATGSYYYNLKREQSIQQTIRIPAHVTQVAVTLSAARRPNYGVAGLRVLFADTEIASFANFAVSFQTQQVAISVPDSSTATFGDIKFITIPASRDRSVFLDNIQTQETCADGFVCVFEWDCSATSGVFTLSTDCAVSSETVISGTGSLTITGIPDVTTGVLPKITGGGSNRLFKVVDSAQLTIVSLHLMGGRASSSGADGSGGAIYAFTTGFVSISSCVFTDNRSSGTGEGALYFNNDGWGAWQTANTKDAGWLPNSETPLGLRLNGNTFVSNVCAACTHGGSAAIVWGTANYVYISNCVFTQNTDTSTIHNGALTIYYARNILIENSRFTQNVASVSSSEGASAVFLYSASVLIKQSVFKGNTGQATISLFQQTNDYYSVLGLDNCEIVTSEANALFSSRANWDHNIQYHVHNQQ